MTICVYKCVYTPQTITDPSFTFTFEKGYFAKDPEQNVRDTLSLITILIFLFVTKTRMCD